MNDIKQDARELMTALESPMLKASAKEFQDSYNAMDDLKNETLSFFKNRMESINRAERIKELTYQQLEVDIQSGSLNFDQKMALLMRLSRDNNELSDSIISMFRPAGNGGGSLLTDIVRPCNDKSDLVKAFEQYTPEQLQQIDATMKVIRDIVENSGAVSAEMPADGKTPSAGV
jgi:ribosomal protein L20